ncbi:MAG: hypothetical protein K9K63_15410 [Desulfotignum sp.]|nr:hypothetical protein [Desulfotignum sp.]MCF8138690.1 hypothetical protein [Desulfotignum sp.]
MGLRRKTFIVIVAICLTRIGSLVFSSRLVILTDFRTLEGLIPICSYCKNIRNDEGFWQKVDEFMHHHTHAQFSHSICPDCAKQHFPECDLYKHKTK